MMRPATDHRRKRGAVVRGAKWGTSHESSGGKSLARGRMNHGGLQRHISGEIG